MRFSPNKEVTLFFKDGKAGSKNVTIKYCDNAGVCIDESLNDPSLAPFRIGMNIVGRKLGHFSGYVVAYEDGCVKALSLSTCDVTDGLRRKSGYMVASGEDIKDVMKGDKPDPMKDQPEK